MATNPQLAASQQLMMFDPPSNFKTLLPSIEPYYSTRYGAAYLGDSLEVLKALPGDSVNAVVTSPPYALHFQKEYGNVTKDNYVEWFVPFASEVLRVLTADGSFVLNIGGSYNKGTPTRSLYHFKLLLTLVEELGFHLAQECFWYNPAKMPMPAEWVTVRRIRLRDSVEYVWWLSKTPWPKANNRHVLRPYSKDMQRLNAKGIQPTTRPSGHNINTSFSQVQAGGSIPSNVMEDDVPADMLKLGNNSSNDAYIEQCKQARVKPHPARFPIALPEFFIKMLTDPGDLVFDPFGGSMVTGAACEALGRRWIGVELVEDYLIGSRFRFQGSTLLVEPSAEPA